ncbi:MAG TPA: tRNA (adenosine(37)-N6)-threonylcarbamoyltransferase complex ATPase subunit type 1 TsaE [Candidatus Gracilibacteria bacterium]|nr:tRNA (adenosine(37)-N6)-threonylcarbamoyltransferase complex ATPase subunit type 1 TsaE [Candidatus Gracilibacteria bacterium]
MRRYRSRSEAETRKIASRLASRMTNGGFVCLKGDLGSGKTVFAKGFAAGLGVREKNIKSPTYTFIRQYRLKRGYLFHFDFYRIEEPDELMETDLRDIFSLKKKWVVIEWPERVAKLLPAERTDITMEYVNAKERLVTLKLAAALRPDIKKIWQKHKVPGNIRRHMKKVADVAEYIGERVNQRNPRQPVDIELLRESALLHDILKLIPKGDHAEAGARELKREGFPEHAAIIAKHGFNSLSASKKEKRPATWEEKILYYADKRVKHDAIASVKERLEDGRKRYFPDGKIPAGDGLVVKKLYKLEREICQAAKLKPEEISEKTLSGWKRKGTGLSPISRSLNFHSRRASFPSEDGPQR